MSSAWFDSESHEPQANLVSVWKRLEVEKCLLPSTAGLVKWLWTQRLEEERYKEWALKRSAALVYKAKWILSYSCDIFLILGKEISPPCSFSKPFVGRLAKLLHQIDRASTSGYDGRECAQSGNEWKEKVLAPLSSDKCPLFSVKKLKSEVVPRKPAVPET